MSLLSIYNHSPIPVQNLMTTIKGLLFKKERFGKEYYESLSEFKERKYGDYNELLQYQWERTEELIRYALENSAFYKDFYKDIDVESVIKKREITLLPILDKETVRQNIKRMYTINDKEGIESNTSGTTGKSIRFVYRRDDLQRRMAYLDAFKIKHGYIPLKMKRASFGSSKVVPKTQVKKIFWRDNLAINQRLYSGYHCKGDNVKYFVENLKKYKPESIDGYPSAIYEISQYILEHDVDMGFIPIAVFPTAETLLPHYKTIIEKAFKCPVRDQYASSEGAPFIIECSEGKLHYCMDTGIIEFHEDGRMLVTCFETHGTPLIRYDIGDRAFLSTDQKCRCGCCMPIVERIEGRSMDYIRSPQNGKFSAIYLSLVSAEFNNSIIAMQFIQNDINTVEVNIVADENYRDDMAQIIIDKLHYSLGNDVEIIVRRVQELIKESSGKTRFIINNIG